MSHEAIDEWLDRSQDVLDDYDAFRGPERPLLGEVVVETQVEVENVPETPLRGSESISNAHTSPNFYA